LLDPLVLSTLLEHHPTPEIYQQLTDVRLMLQPDLARAAATRLSERRRRRRGDAGPPSLGRRPPGALLDGTRTRSERGGTRRLMVLMAP
jgi:hypothetical protein